MPIFTPIMPERADNDNRPLLSVALVGRSTRPGYVWRKNVATGAVYEERVR